MEAEEAELKAEQSEKKEPEEAEEPKAEHPEKEEPEEAEEPKAEHPEKTKEPEEELSLKTQLENSFKIDPDELKVITILSPDSVF